MWARDKQRPTDKNVRYSCFIILEITQKYLMGGGGGEVVATNASPPPLYFRELAKAPKLSSFLVFFLFCLDITNLNSTEGIRIHYRSRQ